MRIKVIAFCSLLATTFTAGAQQNIPDSLEHQGYQRLYITHLPPAYNGAFSVPVVITLHGGSGNYQSVQGFTQMNFVSNQNNFLAVYPQGIGSAPPGYSWADGRNTTADQAGIDDIGFVSKLIDSLSVDYNIDVDRVYICGYSNGGFMTQRLACEIPEKFAAIGGLGCSMDTTLYQSCNPEQAVPMVYFSGTSDPEVPYLGGTLNNPSVTPIVPVDTAVHYWVNNNNCQTEETAVFIPNTVQSDSSNVEFYKFTDCDCNADFYFYKIINGGHTWPGVPVPQFPQLGNTNEDIHGSYLVWDFFNQFSTCATVGINEINPLEINLITVYPNPTTDILQVESSINIQSITVYDIHGQRVISQLKPSEIDLRSLDNGIYFIQFRSNSTYPKMIKVIKE
ncbi:MAG: T9SS type A sorting domain-containing protein [Bacteroidota bacterium]